MPRKINLRNRPERVEVFLLGDGWTARGLARLPKSIEGLGLAAQQTHPEFQIRLRVYEMTLEKSGSAVIFCSPDPGELKLPARAPKRAVKRQP